MTVYQRTELNNGIKVVTEFIPHVRSAAIGFWYKVGSRHEQPSHNGISHFIEHLMFKGTKHYSARQIAEIVDASGGQLNAFTSKEHTCYYARVLDEHVGLAIEVLADMLRHSLFAPEEMEKEKGVVLEEIKMYEDAPDELIHDLFAEAIFDAHPLGQNVLGHAASVGPITREDVLSYLERFYTSDRLVVAAAGNLDHDSIVQDVQRFFGDLPKGMAEDEVIPVPKRGRCVVREKDTELVHLCMGAPALPRRHEDEYVVNVLDVALGGGMSSRFFQDLREDRGLVYSTYSYHSAFQEGGLFGVYAGVSPSNAEQVIQLIRNGFSQLLESGLSHDEVHRAKEQLKGSLMIGLEHTANRMSRIARTELFDEELLSPDELIRRVEAVTLDDLHRVAQQLFGKELYLAAVGPVDPSIATHVGADLRSE